MVEILWLKNGILKKNWGTLGSDSNFENLTLLRKTSLSRTYIDLFTEYRGWAGPGHSAYTLN